MQSDEKIGYFYPVSNTDRSTRIDLPMNGRSALFLEPALRDQRAKIRQRTQIPGEPVRLTGRTHCYAASALILYEAIGYLIFYWKYFFVNLRAVNSFDRMIFNYKSLTCGN